MEIDELLKKWKDLLKPRTPTEGISSGSPKRGKITAAELHAELEKDEDYQRWLKEKEAVGNALDEAYAKDAKPLLDDLASIGIKIESVWDLVNTKSSYKTAIPKLIEHLPRPYHIRNKEGIVRSLGVKEAKGKACRVIIDEYNRTPKDQKDYRWTFGNAMSVIMTPEYADEVIDIVEDESNGDSRHMFIASLSKAGSPKVMKVLEGLLSDNSEMIRTMAQKVINRLNKK